MAALAWPRLRGSRSFAYPPINLPFYSSLKIPIELLSHLGEHTHFDLKLPTRLAEACNEACNNVAIRDRHLTCGLRVQRMDAGCVGASRLRQRFRHANRLSRSGGSGSQGHDYLHD